MNQKISAFIDDNLIRNQFHDKIRLLNFIDPTCVSVFGRNKGQKTLNAMIMKIFSYLGDINEARKLMKQLNSNGRIMANQEFFVN